MGLKYKNINSLVILTITMLLSLSGCANRLVNHGFHFNAKWESPNIEILGFRYGKSIYNTALSSEDPYGVNKIPQQHTIIGKMLRGDDLYVKWKVKSTGVIYEDTVNLKKLMPLHITNHDLQFIVKGSQLHVYLISPYKISPNACPSKEIRRQLYRTYKPDNIIFSNYCGFSVKKIYPVKNKTKGDVK